MIIRIRHAPDFSAGKRNVSGFVCAGRFVQGSLESFSENFRQEIFETR